ncbi:unnamed protein product [Pylaiella littoralis]
MGTTKSSLAAQRRSRGAREGTDHAISPTEDSGGGGSGGGSSNSSNGNGKSNGGRAGSSSSSSSSRSSSEKTRGAPSRRSRRPSNNSRGSPGRRLSLFKKTPPRHSSSRHNNSLPGGAAASQSTTANPARTAPPGILPSPTRSTIIMDGTSPPAVASSSSGVMGLPAPGTRPISGESRGRPGTGDSRGGLRASMRFIRQPSTYGELHDMVAKQKLGGGVIRGLCGLENLGNTCFMNSALQCLVNCEALADYFLGFDWKAEINESNFLGHKGLMATAFGALANEMWRSERASIRPDDFKRQVGESMPLFAGYEQQDVQEFLAFLLDAVHEDLNRVPNSDRKYIEAKEAKEGELEEKVAMEAWKGYLERNRSIIVDLFQGQLRSALQCGVCGRRSVTFDPFMYLTVPLPDNANQGDGEEEGSGQDGEGRGGGGGRGRGAGPKGVTLESCIQMFCEEETLDGDNAWYCSNCKKHQPATKKLDLWKVPPVLIVHLKRFAGSAKISSPVEFPLEGLDLTEVVKSPQKEPPDYDLIGTANHHGSVYGGHYTAAAKNRVSGNWNLFNDERVEGLEPCEVQSASAYVLFYTKMSTLQESVEDDAEGARRQRQSHPEYAAANAAVEDGLGSLGAVGAGRRGSASESPVGYARRRRATTGDAKAASPKRSVAVVRRQSVTKPYNWPHFHVDDSTPSLQPVFEPTGPAALQLQASAQQSMDVCSPAGGRLESSSKCRTLCCDRRLTRSMAEQGYGSPLPGGARGTTLPAIRGTSLPPHAGGGAYSGPQDGGGGGDAGVIDGARGRRRSLRVGGDGGGGGGDGARRPS